MSRKRRVDVDGRAFVKRLKVVLARTRELSTSDKRKLIRGVDKGLMLNQTAEVAQYMRKFITRVDTPEHIERDLMELIAYLDTNVGRGVRKGSMQTQKGRIRIVSG